MNSYYNSIAPGYDELHKAEQENKLRIIKKELEKELKMNKETRLLDVGCGSGVSFKFFDCSITGIDPSEELLKIAVKEVGKRDVELLQVGAEEMPFEDNLFDIVIAVSSVHNFKDIGKGLDNIKMVGKNRFVFSILKKSEKFGYVKEKIKSLFNVDKMIEEEKDLILFCHK